MKTLYRFFLAAGVAAYVLISSLSIFWGITPYYIGYKRSIDSGEMLGLKIGQSKQQVISHIQNSNLANYLTLAVATPVRILASSANKEELLDLVLEQPGIVMSGSGEPRLYIKISFQGSLIHDVFLAPVNKGEDLGLVVGENKKSVKEIILNELNKGRIDRVFGFVPNSDLPNFEDMNEQDRMRLLSHDTWTFDQIGEHAIATLYFSDGFLRSMDYTWSAIEGL